MYSNDLNIFSTETETWALTGVINPLQPKTTFCGPITMIGGYGIVTVGSYISRTYTSLPSHNLISFTVTLLIMDTWQAANEVEITIDSQSAFKGKPTVMIASGTIQRCHQSPPDFINSVVGKLFHSGPTLTIIFTYTLQTNYGGNFGVKELKMKFANATASDVKQSCVLSSGTPTDTLCQCPSAYYYDATTIPTCQRCHSTCQECFGPSARDCAACPTGASYVAESDSCVLCASLCLLCSGPETKDCNQCEENAFRYWNNSCKSNCPTPYIQGPALSTLKQCMTPCQASNTFMNWDNTCISSCVPPFIARVDGQAKFCDFPCSGEKKFYDSKENKCRATCEYPYQLSNSLICELGLSDDEVTRLETLGTALGITGNVSSIVAKSISLLNFANPAAMLLDVFADLLLYIKYMKVGYPPKVKQSFLMKLNMPIKIIPDIPENVAEQIPLYPIPEKFEEYDVHSSFLVNFWDSLIYLGATIFAIIFASIIGFCNERPKAINWVYEKLNEVFKWNFTLSLFTSYFTDIVLFSSLEFRTADPTTFVQALSFGICFFINFMALVGFAKIMHVIYLNWKLVKKSDSTISSIQLTELQNKLKPYESIFESCKDRTIKQQALVLVLLGRAYVYVCIISYLVDFPLIQAILITLLSLLMLLYLFIERPPKSIVDLLQYVANELILFCAKICVLILAVMDYRGNSDNEARETIGEIILDCNIAFSAVAAVYLCIQLLGTIYEVWKFVSKTCLKSKSSIVEKQFQVIVNRLNANRKIPTRIDNNNSENMTQTNRQVASIPDASETRGRLENRRPIQSQRELSTLKPEENHRDTSFNTSNQYLSDLSFQENSVSRNDRSFDVSSSYYNELVSRLSRSPRKFESNHEQSFQVSSSNYQYRNSARQGYSTTEIVRSPDDLIQKEPKLHKGYKDYHIRIIEEKNDEQINHAKGNKSQQFLIQDDTFERNPIGTINNGRIKARRDNRIDILNDY